MSDDDEEETGMELPVDQSASDMLGFGPLLPTESERTLMDRVRQELKIELKQVYTQHYCSLLHVHTNTHLNHTITCMHAGI